VRTGAVGAFFADSVTDQPGSSATRSFFNDRFVPNLLPVSSFGM
jgi:hypothetical protein